jgi:hypothetical protein
MRMRMTFKCNIGWHDYHEFNDRTKIHKILTQMLYDLGFTWTGDGKNKKTIYCMPYFTNGKISIADNRLMDNDIESCIPCFPSTKVCVKCKKIKINYDIENIKSMLQSIIDEKTKEYEKEELATQILNNEKELT